MFFFHSCSYRFSISIGGGKEQHIKFKSVVKYYKETLHKALSALHSYVPVQLRLQSTMMCLITMFPLLPRLFLSSIL